MAKSYNNLWQRMIDPDNIEAAIYAAAKGKRKKREVQRALADMPATVERIKGMLERDEWRPPEVREGRLYADGIECFQTIDVAAIERAIARKIRDKRVMRLVRMVLASNAVRLPDGTMQTGGVPIGLFTSPWFVNIALTETDHAVKDVAYLYVRYIDDMLLMHGNRRALRKVVGMVEAKVGKMGMRLKRPGEVFIFGARGVEKIRFTGCRFTRERMCVRDRVFLRARRTGAMIRRKLKRRERVTAHDAERLISYGGRFRSFGSYAAFPKEVLRGIKFALMRRKVSMRDKLRVKGKVA